MKNDDFGLELLTPDEVDSIKKEVAFYLNKTGFINRKVREDIFSILETESKVIYYPIEDDEICAFYKKVNGFKFVFINTAIPFEKQIFAAAHELAHVWNIAGDKSEVLQGKDVRGYTEYHEDRNNDIADKAEDVANRFAAEFLVEETILRNILIEKGATRNSVELSTIIELMDYFLVPYKTIVRRLFEINFILRDQCEELLSIPARGEESPIIRLQNRLELCLKNNERAQKIKLANLVDLSLSTYEQKLRTYQSLKYLLAFSNKTPEQFGITEVKEELLGEEELERMLSEDE